MRNPFKLLLPALIPSWSFFDVIAPSPRIEYALLRSCLLYTSPSPRDGLLSRMPSSA